MVTKRIQLRGISRSPSDRMTDDGGVAESLNAYLDNSEQAPVIVPEDITAISGLPENENYGVIFLHKGTGYAQYICLVEQKIGVWKQEVQWEFSPFLTLAEDETLTNVTALGNTLVVSTNMDIYYILRKEGSYSFLGSNLPFPSIRLYDKASEDKAMFNKITHTLLSYSNSPSNPQLFLGWNAYEKDENGNDRNSEPLVREMSKLAWQYFATMKARNDERGVFSTPILAKFALRLKTGEYIDSDPFLIGGGLMSGITGIGQATKVGDYWTSNIEFTLNCCYNLAAKLTYKYDAFVEDLQNWKDVISSLDIFISTDILPSSDDYSIAGTKDVAYPLLYASAETTSVNSGGTVTGYNANIRFGKFDEKDYEKTLLAKDNFYLARSIELVNDSGYLNEENLQSLRQGIVVETTEIMQQEERVNRERLDYTYRARHRVIAEKAIVYNSSLLLAGVSTVLPGGPAELSGKKINDPLDPPRKNSDATSYRFKFHIRGTSETLTVVGRWLDGGKTFPVSADANGESFTWLTFPDSRCFKVDIEKRTSSGKVYCESFEMKPHPNLACAYLYLGSDVAYGTKVVSENSVNFDEENPREKEIAKIYQSSLLNPFYFPLEGRVNVGSGEVLNVAVATTALSQGQFGQFPLYVFTADGIWALETGADGSFVSSKPLSREVCVNPDSVTSIDQAVIFVTDKGVMLLQGSQITELSPYMNGRHYTIEESAKNIIKCQSGFCNYLDVLSDATPFMAFIREASVAYDYAGKRLIFVNPDEAYQYTYSLGTNTWHKIAHGYRLTQVLNAYPQCLIAAEKEDGTSLVLDFTTVLDSSVKQYTERAVIATRPFDLAEPDVLKTITDVRVRGQFPRGAVKFILLGSNDGINFHTASTLRGKSWKLFRMIILADLEQHERVSWVDIQYETRFTNRLR